MGRERVGDREMDTVRPKSMERCPKMFVESGKAFKKKCF